MMGLSRIKPQIHSLRVKVTLRVILIVLLIFAVADFFSSRWITNEIEADYKEKAVLMGMHIIHDLGTAMVARNHEGVSEVLDLYRGYKGVDTTPELACLRDISRFIQTTRTLGYPNEKVMVILNRAGMLGGVDPREIEPVLHHPLDGQIPDDAANALRSLNRGIPLIMRYSRSPASKAIRKLAQDISTVQVQEIGSTSSAIASTDQAGRDALKASSNFG